MYIFDLVKTDWGKQETGFAIRKVAMPHTCYAYVKNMVVYP